MSVALGGGVLGIGVPGVPAGQCWHSNHPQMQTVHEPERQRTARPEEHSRAFCQRVNSEQGGWWVTASLWEESGPGWKQLRSLRR